MNSFNSAYTGTPPWDIGRPQIEFVHLAKANEIRGSVLDVGCGTGENSLYLAELDHEVWGIDSAPAAINKAMAKARERGLEVNFLLHDAIQLKSLRRTFDTAIDCGLFHTFSNEERPVFAKNLTTVLRPGGTYYMLCFSEYETSPGGPRRVSQAEIRDTFQKGWKINYIRDARFESNIHAGGVRAWLSSITFQPTLVGNQGDNIDTPTDFVIYRRSDGRGLDAVLSH